MEFSQFEWKIMFKIWLKLQMCNLGITMVFGIGPKNGLAIATFEKWPSRLFLLCRLALGSKL